MDGEDKYKLTKGESRRPSELGDRWPQVEVHNSEHIRGFMDFSGKPSDVNGSASLTSRRCYKKNVVQNQTAFNPTPPFFCQWKQFSGKKKKNLAPKQISFHDDILKPAITSSFLVITSLYFFPISV